MTEATLTRAVLDSNIWDELEMDAEARERTQSLCDAGELEILVPATLLRELNDSPFDGVPTWFPTTIVSDSVFVLDHSRLDGTARLGEGEIFAAHRGESQNTADAIIVDAADSDADVFVSEDRRARFRYERLRDRGRALDFNRFRAEVLGL